jgi:hypothetical protein
LAPPLAAATRPLRRPSTKSPPRVKIANQDGDLRQINRQYKAYRLAQVGRSEKAVPYSKFIERFTAGLVRDAAATGRAI